MDLLPIWLPFRGGKPKLPRCLSWVVGVELLFKRFAHVPQYGDLQVCFRDRPLAYHYRMDQIVREGRPYPVFTVRYSTMFEPYWSFMVYPVEGKRRAATRALLETTAFPSVDAWLCEPRSETWLAQPHHLRCIFNQVDNRIDIEEEDR